MCLKQLKQFGPGAKTWIVELFNRCREFCEIPNLWRKAKLVLLWKHGKDPNSPKNYRPISLLCQLFKLYGRLILNRIVGIVDAKLFPQQASFPLGKSCTSQILNLIEHIKEGLENEQITGLVLVDLEDHHFVKIDELLFQNRQFYVALKRRKSRWRCQKDGLTQESVLAQILFNLYRNDP